MKNIICIIARTNSKRLPEKTLLEINGYKMIEHIIDSMKEVKLADKIYLCTSTMKEDEILLELANKNNIEAYAGSPDSVIDRILDVAGQEDADNVLRVTGDNIFTDPIFLDYALEQHVNSEVDYTRVERLPLGVTGEIMRVSALIDCYNRIDPDKSEYLAVYMFDPKRYKCLTILPPKKFELPYKNLSVDTPQDWDRTRFIFDKVKEKKIYFGDIVELGNDLDIPYYSVSKDDLIKMPDNEVITFEGLRAMYDEKIIKSVNIQMEESFYENERDRRKL